MSSRSASLMGQPRLCGVLVITARIRRPNRRTNVFQASGIAGQAFFDECLVHGRAMRPIFLPKFLVFSATPTSPHNFTAMNYTPCFCQQPSRVCAEETESTPQQTLLEVLIEICPMEVSLTGGSVLPGMPQSRRMSISIGFAIRYQLTSWRIQNRGVYSILVGKTFFDKE